MGERVLEVVYDMGRERRRPLYEDLKRIDAAILAFERVESSFKVPFTVKRRELKAEYFRENLSPDPHDRGYDEIKARPATYLSDAVKKGWIIIRSVRTLDGSSLGPELDYFITAMKLGRLADLKKSDLPFPILKLMEARGL